MIMTIVFITLILGFLAMDLVVWLCGRETMSQYIIRRANSDGLLEFLLATALITAACFLMLHWELLS